MKEIILDTLIDGVKLLPFLFVTFLLIEFFEHKMTEKSKKWISKSEKLGPIIGSTVGIFPQCGFSVAATNLYVTKIVSLGTLIAVYLSTSDEMLPILLSANVPFSTILMILGIKWITGIIFGIMIDFLFRNKNKVSYEICEEEHCHCQKGNIVLSTLKHTFNTFLFILGTTFFINLLFENFGQEYLSKLFLKDSFFAPFLAAFIGFIPNCGASIMLTELYVNDVITLGSCMAGLLPGSGVAILVLLKTNHDWKENFKIIAILYTIGAFVGLLLQGVTL